MQAGVGRYVLFFALAIGGCLLDLATKSISFGRFFDAGTSEMGQPQQIYWWIEGVFGLQTSHNPGALFGMGAGLSWLFALISLLAIAGNILFNTEALFEMIGSIVIIK